MKTKIRILELQNLSFIGRISAICILAMMLVCCSGNKQSADSDDEVSRIVEKCNDFNVIEINSEIESSSFFTEIVGLNDTIKLFRDAVSEIGRNVLDNRYEGKEGAIEFFTQSLDLNMLGSSYRSNLKQFLMKVVSEIDLDNLNIEPSEKSALKKKMEVDLDGLTAIEDAQKSYQEALLKAIEKIDEISQLPSEEQNASVTDLVREYAHSQEFWKFVDLQLDQFETDKDMLLFFAQISNKK